MYLNMYKANNYIFVLFFSTNIKCILSMLINYIRFHYCKQLLPIEYTIYIFNYIGS